MAIEFQELEPRVAAYLAPIPGASPAGQPARLDAEYQAIGAEVAKLDAVTGGAVDWKAVEGGASRLLQTRSKDLVLAAYLAQALHVRQGTDGLVTGTALLAAMMERYWDGLQPDVKRLKGRANALQWFVDRVTPAVQALPEASLAATESDALEAALVRLADVCRDRLGPMSPAFGALLSSVSRLRPPAPAAPEEAPPAPEGDPATASPPPAAAAPPATARPAVADGDPRQAIETAADLLVEAASRIRETTPADPAAYRALRVGLWIHLDAAPPGTGGRTAIPPPPGPLMARLALLEQNQQWSTLVEEVESCLPRQRFSLDLQRLAAQALGGLGPEYERARTAVVAEVRALLGRIPAIRGAAFSDGTPVADPRTRAWLDEEIAPRASAAAPASSDAGGQRGNDALRLLAEGRVAEAMEGAQQALAGLPVGRERFLLRLELARACARAGLLPLALATFRALDEEAREHRLDAWEPAVAGEVLQGLVSALRAAGRDARGPSTELEECLRRLCRLDLRAAHEVWS